jgi:hypothetical protein
MLKNKLYKKLLVAGIAGTLLISSAVVAFASTNSNSTNTPKSAIESRFGHRGDIKKGGNPLTAILAKEVTAGVITQPESDAITAFMKTKEATDKTAREALKTKLDAMTAADKKAYIAANKPVRDNILADLVTANLLTQVQSDTIKAAMPQGTEGVKQGNPLASVLKTEVTAGVITQAQSDSATAFIKTKTDAAKVTRDAEKAKFDAMTADEKTAAMAARKTAMEALKTKLAGMSDADKKAYMKANMPARDNILADLVTANIFTQAQADTIQTAVKAAMPQRSEMGKKRGEASTNGANTTGTSSTVTE